MRRKIVSIFDLVIFFLSFFHLYPNMNIYKYFFLNIYIFSILSKIKMLFKFNLRKRKGKGEENKKIRTIYKIFSYFVIYKKIEKKKLNC